MTIIPIGAVDVDMDMGMDVVEAVATAGVEGHIGVGGIDVTCRSLLDAG